MVVAVMVELIMMLIRASLPNSLVADPALIASEMRDAAFQC